MNRRKLGRRCEHVKALKKNLFESLIKYGSIQTTISKGKDLIRWGDPIITLMKNVLKENDVHKRLHLERMIRSKLYDTRLIWSNLKEIAEIMSNRNGGYISIKKIGHRVNDNGIIVNLSIIGYTPKKIDSKQE